MSSRSGSRNNKKQYHEQKDKKFGDSVRRYFGADPDYLIWKEGLLMEEVTIDVVHFELWLKKQKGYRKNESLYENTERMYGKKAAEWVMKVL